MMNIKILGQTWSVQRVPSHDPSLYADGDECVGTTWPIQQGIYISEELSIERTLRTLKHELCHAFISATQANRPDTWSEEAVCEFLAIYGSEILYLANELCKYFFEQPKESVVDEQVDPSV